MKALTLLYLFILTTLSATAQLRPNSFTTNSDPAAKLVVTNIANYIVSTSTNLPSRLTLTNPIIYAATDSSFPVRFATNNGTMMLGGYDKTYDLSTYALYVASAAQFNSTIYGAPGYGLSFGSSYGSITAPAAGQLKASTSFVVASNAIVGGGIYTGTNSGVGTINDITNMLGGVTYHIAPTNTAAASTYGTALLVGTNTTGEPWLMASNRVVYFGELRSIYPGGNIGIGSNAAQVASAGLVNVAIGSSALSKNTNGSYNVIVGAGAAQNATNASSTVAVGYQAQQNLQNGTANTAVGYQAQHDLVTGGNNVSVGQNLQKLVGGSANVVLGNQALNALTNNDYNTVIGYMAHQAATNVTQSIAIGPYALQNSQGAGLAIGYMAGRNSSGGNISIGNQVHMNTTGTGNVGIGTGIGITTGSLNVGISGLNALTTGSQNVGIGSGSLFYETGGMANTAVGTYALANQTNGSGMTAIGNYAGRVGGAEDNRSSLIDTNDTFIGNYSGRSSTIPNTTPLTNAIALGYNAKAIANNTVTLGGTLKEAVALVINPMSVQPTNIAIGNPYIYSRTNASVAELFAVGGDGVETQISPHADDAPPQLYDKTAGDMKEIIWRESNPYVTNGLVSFINLRRMAKLTELNTRAILYLSGVNTTATSNALVRLQNMTVAQRQVLMTENYPTYNARTGNNLQPLDWDATQEQVQATYDMQRENIDLQRTYLAQTNAVIQLQIDSGDTNAVLVALPEPMPVKDVRQPKPTWMK